MVTKLVRAPMIAMENLAWCTNSLICRRGLRLGAGMARVTMQTAAIVRALCFSNTQPSNLLAFHCFELTQLQEPLHSLLLDLASKLTQRKTFRHRTVSLPNPTTHQPSCSLRAPDVVVSMHYLAADQQNPIVIYQQTAWE